MTTNVNNATFTCIRTMDGFLRQHELIPLKQAITPKLSWGLDVQNDPHSLAFSLQGLESSQAETWVENVYDRGVALIIQEKQAHDQMVYH